MTSISDVITA